MHISLCTCILTHTHTHTHACTHTHTHPHTHTPSHPHPHAHTGAHPHTLSHTQSHPHTHTHTHTQSHRHPSTAETEGSAENSDIFQELGGEQEPEEGEGQGEGATPLFKSPMSSKSKHAGNSVCSCACMWPTHNLNLPENLFDSPPSFPPPSLPPFLPPSLPSFPPSSLPPSSLPPFLPPSLPSSLRSFLPSLHPSLPPSSPGYRYGRIPWADADIMVLLDDKGTPKFCLQELSSKVCELQVVKKCHQYQLWDGLWLTRETFVGVRMLHLKWVVGLPVSPNAVVYGLYCVFGECLEARLIQLFVSAIVCTHVRCNLN